MKWVFIIFVTVLFVIFNIFVNGWWNEKQAGIEADEK